LTPRKVNTLYPRIATKVAVSEELVADVVSFYWKEIKKNLEEPDHIKMSIVEFGTFEIRKKQLEYQIEKYKRLVKYIRPTTYNKHALLNIAVNKLARFEKLLKMCEEQEQKKKQIREIQKNGKTV
jgi:nucleoid DNA-binding protein